MLLLAAVVAAVAVPVGFALSLESRTVVGEVSPSAAIVASSAAAPIVVNPGAHAAPRLRDVPDGAKLLAIGTMLFGLAAAVRKVA